MCATFAAALTLAGCSSSPEPQAAAPSQDVPLPLDTATIEGRVPRAATLEKLLTENQVDPTVAASLTAAVSDVFNLRRFQADRSFRLTRSLDGILREFRYDIDATQFLRVVFRKDHQDEQPAFDVAVVPYPREVSVEAASAEITPEHPSLIGAFDAVGESIQLPLAVSEIFNGEIDFNTELQRGDQARVLFERVRREGQPAGYGDVEAAVLEHSGRQFVAVPFPMADGKIAWYDETGRSLKRQFLKSPLPFDPRVTSGFSTNRLHPIFHRVRAHLGVDYAAGIGTAVIAIADGVVESAEWAGEAGRMVVVRHSGGYESMYLHLSSFAVRPGTHVSQGQLLGRVGMSGAATGPHLDFRIKRNGVHLNPLTFRSGMPTGEPIAPNQLAAFQEARDRALAELRELAAPSLVTTARPASRP